MDRTEYLQLCQQNSVKNDRLVLYNNIKYFPYAYKLMFKNGQAIHTAVLKDTNSNSITYCNLKQVTKYGQ